MMPTLLNEKINFVVVDDDGGFTSNQTRTIVKTMYSNILNLNNTEFMKSYSTNSSIIVSFRVCNTRFTKELPFKTKEYQIDWKGNVYDIITAVPTSDMNYVDVKAKAVL